MENGEQQQKGGGLARPSSSNKRAKDVKVKVIVTKTVRTDPMHFKSVVQTLTGKETAVEETAVEEAMEPPAASEKKTTAVEDGGGREAREFEDTLMKLPSIDELKELWDY